MRHERGVSLMEALVALGVMAFGLLGVVGLQATLRYNGDVAKQRSEAVRFAQEAIENRRAFSVLATTAGRDAWDDIAPRPAVTVNGVTSNTTFTITESVEALPDGSTKSLSVAVAWTDRTGQAQGVQLNTAITKVLPEFSASVGIPALGSPTRLPDGRNRDIPRSSIDQGDGTSVFSPPGGGSITWVFNNTSGNITKTCNGGVCTTVTARLLSGFVRFSTGSSQPTPAMAESPTSNSMSLQVSVARTFPTSVTISCFQDRTATMVEYFCAVPVDDSAGSKWSGRSTLDLPVNISHTVHDDHDDRFRVCRYTPVRGSHPVVPTISNAEHPLDYADVTTSLSQQNFLVIRGGDGDDPFTCPADDSSTPYVNGNTWHHQPSS